MRKKLTLKRIIRLTVIAFLLFAAIDLITETAGLPRVAINYLERKFAKRGFTVSIGDARVGVINGIHLDDVICYDAELPDFVVLYAQKAHAAIRISDLFASERKSFNFVLESGFLNIPLEDPSADESIAVLINFERISGFLGSERLLELKVDGKLFSKIGLDVDFAGELPPPREEITPFTMTGIFGSVPPELIRVANLWRDVADACTSSSNIQVRNKIRGDLGSPESIRMNASVRVNSVLFNGVMVEQLDFDGTLANRVAAITSLRYQGGDAESCNGSATIDLDKGELSCEFEGALYPRNLLRSLYPSGLSKIEDLQFHGTPPKFKISIPNCRFDDPSKLTATVLLDWRDATYLQGGIRSLYGNFKIANGTIRTPDLHLVLEPNVDIFAKATCDLKNGTVFIDATQLGDPLPLCGFSPLEDVRQGIKEGFAGFEFSTLARPRFDVEVVYSDGDEPTIVIAGTVQSRALNYNGVHYDSLDARVLVDASGGQIIIENATILCNGAPAMTQIAIDLADGKETLDFDAMSNIDSRSLMRSIQPEWENLLTECGFIFRTTPFAKGSGSIELHKGGDHEVNLSVNAPRLEFFGLDGENVNANLTLRLPEITGSGQLDKASIESITFKSGTITNFKLSDDAVDMDLAIDKTQIETASFIDTKGKLQWRPKKPLTINELSIEEIRLEGDSDVKSSLFKVHDSQVFIHDDGRIQAKAHAKTAIQTMTRTGKEVVKASDVSISNLAFEKKQLSIQGTTKKFDYPPMNASAKNGQFNAYVKDDVISATLNIPELALKEGALMTNVEVVTTTKGGRTQAGFQINGFKRKDITAKNLSGKIEQSGEAYKVTDGRCELLQALPIELRGLRATALSAFNTVTISLKEGTLGIIPKREVGTDGEKRYPIIIDKVRADMVYKDDTLNISKFKAPFYGGRLEARAQTDINRNLTEVVVALNSVKISELLNRGKEGLAEADQKIDGLFTASAGLQLDYSKELQIFGLGKAKIRKAMLYKVPILSDFLSLLKTKAGKISELDCDLHFEGDRMDIVKLETDGKLVSIEAAGHYWWKTEGIDMRFQADILSTWVFQKLLKKRLYGSLDDYKWEDWTAVYDIFRRKSGPKDPTLQKNAKKPAPEKTKPAPEETKPAPEETKPAPEGTKPAPEGTKPAPKEVEGKK